MTDKSIEDIVNITKLLPPDDAFYLAKGGFVGLRRKADIKEDNAEGDRGRVQLLKMRPFTDEDGYISVRDMDMKEIGIVYAIADFPDDQQKLMRDELSLRYFTPVVREITDIKEEYGYTFIKTETDAGYNIFIADQSAVGRYGRQQVFNSRA
jgi:hypothetical protein